MTLLAIDTSAEYCAVCLYDMDSERVLSKQSDNIGRGHAERLMPIIEACMEKASVSYGDISRIGVTNGPGSFTGVRVGLASARGFALSLGVPLITVTTLEACIKEARVAEHSGELVAIIDARREEAFVQVDAEEPFIARYEEIAERLPEGDFALCGSGAARFNEISTQSKQIIHMQSTGGIETIARMTACVEQGAFSPEPLYLRSADAKPQSGFTLQRA